MCIWGTCSCLWPMLPPTPLSHIEAAAMINDAPIYESGRCMRLLGREYAGMVTCGNCAIVQCLFIVKRSWCFVHVASTCITRRWRLSVSGHYVLLCNDAQRQPHALIRRIPVTNPTECVYVMVRRGYVMMSVLFHLLLRMLPYLASATGRPGVWDGAPQLLHKPLQGTVCVGGAPGRPYHIQPEQPVLSSHK